MKGKVFRYYKVRGSARKGRKMESYIGIDYGGTKLLIGEVDGNGKLLSHMRFETGKREQGEIVKHLLQCLRVYKERVPQQGLVRGAGIGIIGMSSHKTGIWHSVNHEPGEAVPLAAMVSEILGVPAAIDNDVRSGTTAELLWGCGRYSKDFIYLSVGTGLAAGMVTDGRILRGANENAGEIGHISVRGSSERQCACGRQGCAELSASGSGIAGNIMEQLKKYPAAGDRRPEAEHMEHLAGIAETGKGSGNEKESPKEKSAEGRAADVKEVFRLAREGDAICGRAAEEAAAVLAEVIHNLVRTSDPDTVVLGGGIMQDAWFLEQVKGRLHPVTMRGVKNGVRISELKPEWIGVTGAAAVGKIYCEEQR